MKHTDIIYRSAEPEDAPSIASELWFNLAKEMEQYSHLNQVDTNKNQVKLATKAFQKLLQTDDSYHLFIALSEDKDYVGFIDFEERKSDVLSHNYKIYIRDIYVKEEYRRNGIGSKLLESVETFAEQVHASYIKIPVEWNNTDAVRLYKSLGYTEKKTILTKPISK